jgi:hypothetical protein
MLRLGFAQEPSAMRLTGPVLLLHGDADPTNAPEECADLVAELRAAAPDLVLKRVAYRGPATPGTGRNTGRRARSCRPCPVGQVGCDRAPGRGSPRFPGRRSPPSSPTPCARPHHRSCPGRSGRATAAARPGASGRVPARRGDPCGR